MEHSMDALLQSDEFRDRLKRIPPHLKGVFVRAVEDLYERESEKMLQLIWESRQDMKETFMTMEEEQNDLRCQSRMLEERRKDSEKNGMYLRGRKSRNGRTSSRMSTASDITTGRGSRDAVDDYVRRRRLGGKEPEDPNDLQLPAPGGARASSAGIAHRAAPTPVFVKSIEELRDELFKHLSTAETKVESERERQRELLEWLKEEKRNKQQEKVEKANELLEEVTQMERVKAKDKERQEQRFKEKLEEKKKLKGGKERGLTPVESIPFETAIQIEPENLIANSVDDSTTKEKKEKRKKKKHRHRDDEESHIGDEENDEEKKERRERKKKHRHRDEDGEAKLEIEDEERRERRKEKKKHHHRHEEDETREDGHEDETEEAKKERKKEKKKHRRHTSEDGTENGRVEGNDDDERKERKKEKKKSKKEKERRKEDDVDN